MKLFYLRVFHSCNDLSSLQVAPVAVSDAAMLAPEEVFEGKGDIKEDAELTQAERKRRRANKKRRYAGIFFSIRSLGFRSPRRLLKSPPKKQ